MPTTHALNFEPDDFEKERIAKAARGNWDASGDLAMLNILYDEKQRGWIKLTEPEDSIKALKESALAGERISTRQLFRVWDQQEQVFVAVPDCTIGLDGSIRFNGQPSSDPDRYLIERSTGQIDKKGREVYIGDILRCQYTWWGQPAQDIYLVKLDEYGRIIPFHHLFVYSHDLWIHLFGSKIEVIGNMHEHSQVEIPHADRWQSAYGPPPYV